MVKDFKERVNILPNPRIGLVTYERLINTISKSCTLRNNACSPELRSGKIARAKPCRTKTTFSLLNIHVMSSSKTCPTSDFQFIASPNKALFNKAEVSEYSLECLDEETLMRLVCDFELERKSELPELGSLDDFDTHLYGQIANSVSIIGT